MTFPLTSLLNCRARFPRCLLVVLFVATAANSFALGIPQRVLHPMTGGRSVQVASQASVAYLATVGPAPFRFAQPPPEPEERPTPPAKIEPAVTQPVAPSPAVSPAPQSAAEPAPQATAEESASGTKPVSILPDDTPRNIRAEDVLPFFELAQDPAKGANTTVVVPFTPAAPAAATLPPSSATYQQK
jgi:hypothetical protein